MTRYSPLGTVFAACSMIGGGIALIAYAIAAEAAPPSDSADLGGYLLAAVLIGSVLAVAASFFRHPLNREDW